MANLGSEAKSLECNSIRLRRRVPNTVVETTLLILFFTVGIFLIFDAIITFLNLPWQAELAFGIVSIMIGYYFLWKMRIV